MNKKSVDTIDLDVSADPESAVHCPAGDACPWKPEVDRLREMVSIDTLTGLYNFRYFTQALDQEMERTRRSGHATAVVMIDLDHFKSVNDTYGHSAGNTVLQELANCMSSSFRKLDVCCRYGGEEFAVILPATELLVAVHVAERLRERIEAMTISVMDNDGREKLVRVTASLGIGLYHRNGVDDVDELMKTADKYLYQAKQTGRNRVCYEIKPLEGRASVSQDEKDALNSIFGRDD